MGRSRLKVIGVLCAIAAFVAFFKLAFTTTGGTGAVVALPSGRYRVRISGRGAFEGQQERERIIDPADRP